MRAPADGGWMVGWISRSLSHQQKIIRPKARRSRSSLRARVKHSLAFYPQTAVSVALPRHVNIPVPFLQQSTIRLLNHLIDSFTSIVAHSDNLQNKRTHQLPPLPPTVPGSKTRRRKRWRASSLGSLTCLSTRQTSTASRPPTIFIIRRVQ